MRQKVFQPLFAFILKPYDGYDPCTTQILAQVINRNEQEKQLILKLIKDLTRYFDNISNL